VSRFWPLVSSAVALGAGILLGFIIFIRGNAPIEADAEWMEEILEHRSVFWEVPALVMNFVGGGWFSVAVPLVVVAVFCILRRFWSALYFALACGLSVVLVQVLKGWYVRPRPEDILVTSDLGSFPSGHTANAATLAVALGLIFWRVWLWAAGTAWIVLMALSRTYLGAHWITDTIGGMLLGAAVAVILWAPFANKLRNERLRT
jgi:undecaprenyl-diphosphatase